MKSLGTNLLLLTMLITLQPAQAEQKRTITFKAEHNLSSHCHPPSEAELRHWYGKCEQRIRRAGFSETSFRGKKITCLMNIDKMWIGEICVLKSSGSHEIDQTALSLVDKASPLTFPPNSMPRDRGLVIEFDYPRLEMKLAPNPKEFLGSGKHFGKDNPRFWLEPQLVPNPKQSEQNAASAYSKRGGSASLNK